MFDKIDKTHKCHSLPFISDKKLNIQKSREQKAKKMSWLVTKFQTAKKFSHRDIQSNKLGKPPFTTSQTVIVK